LKPVMRKTRILVIFGGRSVEHDVSILTGLQFLEALDPTRFDGLPVYVDPKGRWWIGAALTDRSFYPLTPARETQLTPVRLDLGLVSTGGQPQLLAETKGFLGTKTEALPFDLVVPAIHGSNGEDGSLQGLLDFAAIPYAGSPTLGSALAMNKAETKRMVAAQGVKVLPHHVFSRPQGGGFIDADTAETALKASLGRAFVYPLIVKPLTLGSSIGVSKADDGDGLVSGLAQALRVDAHAIVEPCVANLVEYNVAVRRDLDGHIHTSAIERPKTDAATLDFKNKYLSGGRPGGQKAKMGGTAGPSEGMASLNRTLNPDTLTAPQIDQIRSGAAAAFDALDLGGSVRVDFLSDGESGDIWLNEINPIPGSFAYFLWEAADSPVSFLTLTGLMIDEGLARAKARRRNTDAAQGGGQIFQDKG